MNLIRDDSGKTAEFLNNEPQHNYATLKRMHLFNFPSVWNNFAGPDKLNPRQNNFY